jgi:alanine racemase
VFSTCQIELSQGALSKNIRFLRQLIGPRVRFCSVIKGNAYGHGIESFVPLAEQSGVRQFAVFSADEALRAWNSMTKRSEVLIMGDLDEDALEWAIRNEIAFYVFEHDRLQKAITTATRMGRRARVHLELETGMHRTGFEESDLEGVITTLQAAPEALGLEGVCTHYAGAESTANFVRIQDQIATFHKLVERITRAGLRPGLCHSACSAAALNLPETRMDMVRVGIAQYGYWPNEETRMRWTVQRENDSDRAPSDPLRRVIRVRSRVMAKKRVRRGQFVGYGTAYLTTRPQTFAAVPVGYFHGFARSLSNLGHVLIRGRRAPVAGVVNMNMMMVDITDIPSVEKGDEVVIIGRQNRIQLSVGSFSDMTRYLNYEVLVRLPSEIPRIPVP